LTHEIEVFLTHLCLLKPIKYLIMPEAGKLSAKRSKPSYFMAILGVTLVLFIVGFLGWIILNSQKLEQVLRESAILSIYINETTKDREKDSLVAFVQRHPYVKSFKYLDKEEAKKEWLSQGNEDFNQFIDYIMLPRSIDVNFKSEFADSLHMADFTNALQLYPFVNDVKFPKEVVARFSLLRKITFGLGLVALILLGLAVVLIDNTIKLAMFSNRFLIKTMQMVGATRWFISRPMNIRAFVNGTVSAGIAIAAIITIILMVESWVPELRGLRDNSTLLLLCLLVLGTGISISVISTYRSILKYLKMKLDDLY
jgi:cell division transport system permease protein